MLNILQNGLLKMCTTALNYWAEFAVDVPLGAVLIFMGLQSNELDPIGVGLIILLGLFLFSIIEYSFHRWLFHGSIQILVRGHRAHHKNPLGYDSLPFFLPALALLLVIGMLVLFMPASCAFLLTGAIIWGYVIYGLSHFIIHHHSFHFAPDRNWAANHHIHHRHADANFGVTTPLWDIVFGTRYVRLTRGKDIVKVS